MADDAQIRLEFIDPEDCGTDAAAVPVVWSESDALVEKRRIARDDSTMAVGLQLIRGTLERMSSKQTKKSPRKSPPAIRPKPIQLALWPSLLTSEQNVVGVASTGSGKTLAYAIPAVAKCIRSLLLRANTNQGPSSFVHGLVLVPTRELAIQVSKEIRNVCKIGNKSLSKLFKDEEISCLVESLAVYGGVDIHEQKSSLFGKGDSGFNSLIVAATPGRLLDILEQSEGQAKDLFSQIHMVIFDEADRTALNPDMCSQVDDILTLLDSFRDEGKNVVHCLISATLPEKAKPKCDEWAPSTRLVAKLGSVTVGQKPSKTEGDDETSGKTEGKKKKSEILDLASMPPNIVQTLHVCASHKKPKKLISTLKRIYERKANSVRFSNNQLCIVFFAQVKTLKFMQKLLFREGLRCAELYGTLSQAEREKRLLEFRAGKTPILLATDVVARGIHIPNVTYAINYDFPTALEQYVHRCGRVGRKQQSLGGDESKYGIPTVYSFFTRDFAAMADSLIELLRSSNAFVDPNLLALSKIHKPSKSGSKKRKRSKADDKRDDKDAANEIGDDDFAFLGRQNVLKRASHVSDAEPDSDASDDD